MKNLITISAIAALAGTASAQFTASNIAPHAINPATPAADRTANGDLVETGLAVFSNTEGVLYDAPLFHEIGTTETLPNVTNVEVSSSVIDNGNLTRTLDISWTTNDASALFGPNGLNGNPIVQLSFELGENNFPNDFVEDPDYAGLTNFDPNALGPGMGSFVGDFSLLDAAGASLFDGNIFLTDQGTGFSGIVVIGAGGADLGNFNIGGGSASITYNIPTPASASLLAAGGIAATRRRR